MTRLLLTVAALATLTQASCIIRPRHVHEVTVVDSGPQAEVVVTEAPPAPQVEVIPVAPSPSHLWIGGYWAHRGGRWVWIGGTYVVRPAHRAHWEPGHWVVRSGGRWIWVPGRWV